MRPLRLEVRGFTAFREPTTVDFEGRRLFAITGPTGAGKSSLLDAMTWALYGQVPRVGNSTRQLVSHGAPSMSVLFEFETHGKRYRVARRAPGTASTRLEEQLADGEWRGLADRARDITEQVTRILGLDYATFTKTVLLPQGAFDSFLKGDQSARREIMTRLLGLGVYTDVRQLASRRATRAKDRAEVIRHQLEQLHLAAPEQIASLQAEHEQLEAKVQRLVARREELGALGDLARAHRDAANGATEAGKRAETARQALCDAESARDQAAQALETARERHATVSKEREELGYDADAHRELDRRVTLVVRREEARTALEHARRQAEQSAKAVQAAEREQAEAQRALSAADEEAKRCAAALEAAGATASAAAGRAQRALEELRAAAERLEADAGRADAEAQQHEQRARRLEGLREQLEVLDGEVKRSAEALEAASREAAETTQAADAAQAQRRSAEQAVEARRADLDRARVEHAAATIQRSLQPGDPCPVCGEPVGEIAHHDAPDLDAAEAALAEAERTRTAAAREAEVRASAAAACAAREQECRRAAEESEAKRRELSATLVEQDVEEARLQEAVAAAEADAARYREQASSARAEAGRRQAEAQDLRVALARLPDGIEPDAGESDAEASPGPLDAAIETHRDATAATQAAEVARREAEGAVALASRSVQQAQERCSEAETALAQAEATLQERTAEEDGDAEELRAALQAAERAARRASDLDAAVATAASEIVRAESRGEAATAQVQRAASEANAATEAATAAEQTATEALAAFERGWRTTVADGQPASFDALRSIMAAHAAEQDGATRDLGVIGERLEQARKQAEDAKRMRTEAADYDRQGGLASTLAQELQGNRFVAYVQHEAMSLLAADASTRLAEFTSGRYELAADGDEFEVVDRLNGDEHRSVKTLSGGETFLASLALALSLSEHLPQLSGTGGAVSLESLFLDEGFGSLDAESLDLAVQGLETLAGGHRVIGVISHVAELAERLPDRIEVVKGAVGSTVRA